MLNVKYLLLERRREYQLRNNPGTEGAQFSKTTLNLSLGQQARMQPGTHLEISAPEVEATELAVVTTMNSAAQIPDGTPVVGIKLHTKGGRVIERELQAGRDTAEWAYDRADVRPAIRHPRARIFQSEEQAGYQGHTYLARLAFERAEMSASSWITCARRLNFISCMARSTTRSPVSRLRLMAGACRLKGGASCRTSVKSSSTRISSSGHAPGLCGVWKRGRAPKSCAPSKKEA